MVLAANCDIGCHAKLAFRSFEPEVQEEDRPSGEEVTVKRLYREGETVRLQAQNGDHVDIVVAAEEFAIQGLCDPKPTGVRDPPPTEMMQRHLVNCLKRTL